MAIVWNSKELKESLMWIQVVYTQIFKMLLLNGISCG